MSRFRVQRGISTLLVSMILPLLGSMPSHAATTVATPTFSAYSSTTTSATVTWTGSSTGVSYYVLALYDSTTSRNLIDSFTVLSASSAPITGLSPGTGYWVTLTAVGDGINYSSATSAFTNILTKTVVQLTAPTAITLTSKTSVAATISWTAPSVSTGLVSYDVKIYDSATSTIVQNINLAAVTSTTLTGLAPNTGYYVTITSIGTSNNGTNSSESSPLYFVTNAPTPVPLPTNFTISTVTANTVTETWTVTSTTATYIHKLFAADCATLLNTKTVSANVGTSTFYDLTPSTTYCLKVQATAPDINSQVSGDSTGLTFTTLAMSVTDWPRPTSASLASANPNTASVTATNGIIAAIGSSNYNQGLVTLYKSSDSSTVAQLYILNWSSGQAQSVTFGGLTPQTSYFATVQGVGVGRNPSTILQTSAATTLTNYTLVTPGAPSTLANSTTATTIGISFANALYASSYTVKVYDSASVLLRTIPNCSPSGQVITELSPNTGYKFSVTAIGDGVTILNSAEGALSALMSTTNSNLSTAVSTFSVVVNSPNQATATFSVTGSVGSYTLKVYSPETSTLIATISGINVSPYTLTDLRPGQRYVAILTAVALPGQGVTGADSAPFTFVTPLTTKLQAPYIALTSGASAVTPTTASITASSTAYVAGQTEVLYRLYAANGTTLVGTYIAQAIGQFTFSNLIPSTTYQVSAQARGNGSTLIDSAEGPKFSFTTLDPTPLSPAAMTNNTLAVTSNSAGITFAAPPAAVMSVLLKIYGSDSTTVVARYPFYVSGTVVNGLDADTTYFYSLTYVGDGIGYLDSPESARVQFRTQGGNIGSPPWENIASATASTVSATTASFVWSYFAGGQTAAAILRIYASDSVTVIGQYPGYTSGSLISGLLPSTNYYATFQQIGNGSSILTSNESAKYPFKTLSGSTLPAPSMGSSVTFTPVSASFTISAIANVSKFLLKLYDSSSAVLLQEVPTYSGSSNTILISGLTPNTSYFYSLTSLGDGVNYFNSPEGQKNKITTPQAMTLTVANLTSTSIVNPTPVGFTVTIPALGNATSFILKIYNNADNSLVETIPGVSANYVVNGLLPNTAYRITITAVGNGISYLNSAESIGVISSTAAPQVLNSPTISNATIGDAGVSIVFSSSIYAVTTRVNIYSADCTTLIAVIGQYISGTTINAPFAPSTTYCATLMAVGNNSTYMDSEEGLRFTFTTPDPITLFAPQLALSSQSQNSVSVLLAQQQPNVLGHVLRLYSKEGTLLQTNMSNTIAYNSILSFSNLVAGTVYQISAQAIGNGLGYLNSPEGPKLVFQTLGTFNNMPVGFSLTPLSSSSVAITFSSYSTFASGFIARVYSADGNTLLSTSAVGTSNTAISGLAPNTTYQVTLTQLGDGITSNTSLESSKVSVTTLPLSSTPVVQPTQQWATSFGGRGTDFIYSVSADSSGNTYAAGYFYNTLTAGVGANEKSLSTFGVNDGYIAKYDSTGELLWIQQMGGTQGDAAYSVVWDKSNAIYVAGTFNGSATFGTGSAKQTLVSLGSQDIFIAKYDLDGNLLWIRQLGSTTSDFIGNTNFYGSGLAVDLNGNLYLAANTGNVAFYVNGVNRQQATGYAGSTIALLRILPDGSLSWMKMSGTTGSATVYHVSLDSTGNIYIGGYYSNAPIILGTGQSAVYIPTPTGTDGFVAKFTNDGVPSWGSMITGNGTDVDYGLSADSNGNVFITGYSGSTSVTFGSGSTALALSNPNPNAAVTFGYLAKYSTNGTVQWVRSLSGLSTTNGYAVTSDSSGNVIVGGYFNQSLTLASPALTQTLTSSGGNDGFVAKYTGRGDLVWAGRHGATSTDVISALTTNSSGDVLVGGIFSWDLPVLGGGANIALGTPGVMKTSNGSYDVLLVKLSSAPATSVVLTSPLPVVSGIKNTALAISFIPVPGAVSYTMTVYSSDSTTVLQRLNNFRSGQSITGLTTGSTYYFSLVAIGDGVATQNSNASAKVSGKTALDSPVPVISYISNAGFCITANPVPGAVGYTYITYASDGVTKISVASNPSLPVLSCFSTLLANTNYYVSVKAIADGSSPLVFSESNQVLVTTKAAVTLRAPTPAVTVSTPSSLVINIPSLLVSPQLVTGALGFLIKIYKADGTTLLGTTYLTNNGSVSTIYGLLPATTYRITATAIGDGINYFNSPEGSPVLASTTQPSVLVSPTPTAVISSAGVLQLFYPNIFGASSYTVRIYGSDTSTPLSTIPNFATSGVISNLMAAGDSTTVTVQAIGDGWNYFTSAESSRITAYLPTPTSYVLPVSAPTIGNIVANSAVIGFSPAVGSTSYVARVYAADGTTLIQSLFGVISGSSITGLKPSTTYQVSLIAIGNGITEGNSSESARTIFTTLAPVKIVAPIPALNTVNGSSFKVNFVAPLGAVTTNVNIYSSDGNTLISTVFNYTSSSIIGIGLRPGTTYRVTLKSIGDGINYLDSDESAYSYITLISAVTLQTPAAFINTIGASSFKVSFNALTGAVSYLGKLYSSTGTLISTLPNLLSGSFVSVGLSSNTSYKFTLTAIGDGINYLSSPESKAETVTTLSPIRFASNAPSVFSIGSRSATLNFSYPTGASGALYKIYNAAGTQLIAYQTIAGSGLPYSATSATATIPNLAPNTTYKATLTYIGDGVTYLNSLPSDPVTFSTPGILPLQAPTPTISYYSSNAVRLTFNTPPASNGTVGTTQGAMTVLAKFYDSTGTTLITSGITAAPGSITSGTIFYGLTPGATYKVTLTAIGDGVLASTSAESEPITFVFTSNSTGTTLGTTSLSISNVKQGSAKINFTSITGATRYVVKIYKGSSGNPFLTYPGFISGAVASGLQPATSYLASITAVGDGTAYLTGAESTKVPFTTPALVSSYSTAQLLPVTPVVGSQTASSFAVSYVHETGTVTYSLNLYSATGILLRTLTNFVSGTVIQNLSPATKYFVTLTAIGDGVNYATATESSQVIALTSISTPTLSQSEVLPTSISVNFETTTSASSYTLYRYASNGTTLQATISNYLPNTAISGLTPSTDYKFTVVAIGNGSTSSNSAASNMIVISTPALVTLSRPVPSIVTTTSSSVTVSYVGASGASSHTLNLYLSDGVTNVRTISNFASGDVVTGLTSNASYKIGLVAVGDGTSHLTSLESNQISFTTVNQSTLSAPSFTVSNTTNSASATFNSISGATSYTAKLFAADGTTLVSVIDSYTSGTLIAGLISNTKYYIALISVGDGTTHLTSALSNLVEFTTSVPTQLVAPTPTTASATPSSFVVSFSSVSNALNYDLNVYTSDGALVSTVNNVSSGYTVTGLSSATLYQITLKSLGNGIDYLSSVESSKVQIATTSPQTLGTPTPTISSVGSGGVTFTFSAAAGSLVTKATIYAADGRTIVGTENNATASGTTITGLASSTQYFISLQSVGDEVLYITSPESALVSFTTSQGVVTLQSPVPSLRGAGSQSLAITFNTVAHASSYTLRIRSSDGSTLIGTYTDFVSGSTVTGLTINTTYQVSIQVIGDGNFYQSGVESSRVDMQTAAPVTLTAPVAAYLSVTSKSAAITFNSVDNALSYNVTIYQADGITQAFQFVDVNSGDIFTGLVPQTSYKLAVTAIGDGLSLLSSTQSNLVSVTTSAPAPLIATSPVVAGTGISSVTVIYTPVDGAMSHTLFVYGDSGKVQTLQTLTSFVSGSVVTGLSPHTTYYLGVKAIADGVNATDSTVSSLTSATTQSSVTLSAPIPVASSVGQRQLGATFSAISGAASYTANLYASDGVTIIESITGYTSGQVISGLTPGANYFLTLTSIGNQVTTLDSVEGNPIQIQTNNLTALSSPSVTVTGTTVSSISASFTQITNAVSYNVNLYSDQYGTLIRNVVGASSPVTITGLDPGTTYYLNVQAVGDGTQYLSSTVGYQRTAATQSGVPTIASVSISGTPQVGSALTTTLGAITGYPDPSADYQWSSSSSLNGTYAPITGATSSSYTPTSADLNKYLQVLVTESNASGTASASVKTSSRVIPADSLPTINSVTIVGTPQVGLTLTTTLGATSGYPAPNISYVWSRASTSNGTFSPISGATSSSYTPTLGDLGKFLKVTATVTNGSGSNSAYEIAPTTVSLVNSMPSIASVSILGSPLIGSTLSINLGSVGGYPTPEVSYQWTISNSLNGSYTNIAGAINSTYLLTILDIGRFISVTVSESNTVGVTSLSAAGVGSISDTTITAPVQSATQAKSVQIVITPPKVIPVKPVITEKRLSCESQLAALGHNANLYLNGRLISSIVLTSNSAIWNLDAISGTGVLTCSITDPEVPTPKVDLTITKSPVYLNAQKDSRNLKADARETYINSIAEIKAAYTKALTNAGTSNRNAISMINRANAAATIAARKKWAAAIAFADALPIKQIQSAGLGIVR